MTLPITRISEEQSIHPASILVVDDDATVCRTISTFLKSRNYKVSTTQNGQEALKLLGRQHFDMVFLDLMMPEVPGIKVLKSIREKYSALQLPVIMLTVSEDVTDIVVCFESGANDYIIKPGTLPVMIARIETQLSLKSMNDALSENKKDLEREVINKEVAYEIAKANLETEMDTRIETEKALHIIERKFEDLYNNTPAVYMKLNAKGHIISVNRFGAYLLGYDREDLVKKSVIDLYHRDDRNLAREYIKETIDDPKRLHRWELRKQTRQGDVLMMRETVRMLEDLDGKSTVVMVSVDVSHPNKSELTIN